MDIYGRALDSMAVRLREELKWKKQCLVLLSSD